MILNCPEPGQSINIVYELPRTEQEIKYPHTCAGLTTKSTWLKVIILVNYTTCPGLTTKGTNKYFPEAEETQKGCM